MVGLKVAVLEQLTTANRVLTRLEETVRFSPWVKEQIEHIALLLCMLACILALLTMLATTV